MAQIHCNFVSYSLGYGVDIEITLPSVSSCDIGPGKAPCHTPPAKYPVVYLLHGHGNDYRCWLRYTSAQRYAEEHRIALVTCSVGNKCYLNDTLYGEDYYGFLQKELPEFICGNFPISGRPEDTYICGYSMGGYGAMIHGFQDTKQYRAMGVFSPGVFHSNSDASRLGHGIPEPVIDIYALLDKIQAEQIKIPDLFLCVGQDDFLYEEVTALHQGLVERGIPHRYDDLPGYCHEFAIWDKELLEFLNWIPRSDYYADKGIHQI